MLTFLLLSGLAHAQAGPSLPVHGWANVEGGLTPLAGRAWVGVALPLNQATAFTIDAVVSQDAAGGGVGLTYEMGSLYLFPAVGAEYVYATGLALTGEVHAVFEAPPLPLYLEEWVRVEVGSPFGGGDVLTEQSQLLVPLRGWVAVGAEHDGAYLDGVGHRLGARANFQASDHVVVGVFAGGELDPRARALAGMSPDWLAVRGTLGTRW